MQLNGYKTCFFELKYFLNCSTVQHSTTEELISYQSQLTVSVGSASPGDLKFTW